jgi:hypothetical protein
MRNTATTQQRHASVGELPNLQLVLQSIGAVLAGGLVVIILSVATDLVLHPNGAFPSWVEPMLQTQVLYGTVYRVISKIHTIAVFPQWGQPMVDALFLLALAYRVLYGVAGGYVAASLAPDRPMSHVVVLGIIGLGLSLVGAIATANGEPQFGPKWFSVTLVITAVPCTLAGGKLHKICAERV